MNLDLIAHDGIFSTAEAAKVGADKNALRRLVDRGEIARLATGWFALTTRGQPPEREELHRLKARALGRQYSRHSAVSHYSRVVLSQLPTHGVDLATVHLTSVVDRVSRTRTGARRVSVSVRRPGVVIHRPVGRLRIPSPDRLEPCTPRTMPLAHALVQTGLVAGPEAFLVPADAALARRLVTSSQLVNALADLAGREGIGPVRAALPLADGRRESPGESRTAFVVSGLGHELEPQFEVVAEGRRFRADFRIKGTRVLIEFDGAMKYADGNATTLFAEKQREDALRRLGWVVVRLVWSDLDDVDRVRQRVNAALALAD